MRPRMARPRLIPRSARGVGTVVARLALILALVGTSPGADAAGSALTRSAGRLAGPLLRPLIAHSWAVLRAATLALPVALFVPARPVAAVAPYDDDFDGPNLDMQRWQ